MPASTHNRYDLSGFKAKLAKPKRGPAAKYPWATMAVLDSFAVQDTDARITSVRSMASAKGRDLGRKFSVTTGSGCCYVTREE